MPVAAVGYTVICVIAGIGMIVFGVYQRRRLRESENWPQSTGTITEAKIVRETSGDSSEYVVHLSYDFAVDGQRHTGNRIEFNRRGYVRKKSAEAQLARYSAGSSVAVYFNPAQPDDAVLSRSAPFNRMYLVFGVALLVFSAAIVGFSLARG